MNTAKALWPYQKLPDWNAEKFFELFIIHRDYQVDQQKPQAERLAKPLNKIQANDLAMQIMNLVAMNFGRQQFSDSLEAKGFGAADEAQEIVTFIYTRAHRFPLANNCKEALIKAVNRTVYRRVMDKLCPKRPRQSAELVDDEAIDRHPDQGPAADVERIEKELVGAMDQILEGIEGDRIALEQIFERQTSWVLKKNEVKPFAKMPMFLKRRSNIEQHGLVTARIIRFIRTHSSEAPWVGGAVAPQQAGR